MVVVWEHSSPGAVSQPAALPYRLATGTLSVKGAGRELRAPPPTLGPFLSTALVIFAALKKTATPTPLG